MQFNNKEILGCKILASSDTDFQIELTGVIDSGWSINSVGYFSDLLQENKGKKGRIFIHSEGGEVTEAIGIANLIQQHGNIETVGVGLVASAATIVLLAGKKVKMYQDGYFMIHNPSAFAHGGADDFRKVANVMDSMADTIAGIYLRQVEKKYAKTLNEIKALMALETWFTAQEAFDFGLIDAIETGKNTTSKVDAKIINSYKKLPSQFIEQQADMSFKELFKKVQDLVATDEQKVDEVNDTEVANDAEITVESASAFLEAAGYQVVKAEEMQTLADNLELLQSEISNQGNRIKELDAENERLKAQFKTAKPTATVATDKAHAQTSSDTALKIANFFKNYKK